MKRGKLGAWSATARRAALLGLSLCVACSSPNGDRGMGAGGAPSKDAGHLSSGSSGGAGGNTSKDARAPLPEASALDDAGLPTKCEQAPPGLPSDAVCVLSVSARAIDENDQPLAKGLSVSACGATQCNPGIIDGDGAFHIGVGFQIVPSAYSVQIHVRPDLTSFYFQLPTGTGPRIDMGNLRSFSMPTTGPALQVDRNGVPAQSVTSGEVTLDVPAGFYVRLDVEANLAAGLGKQFRALRIPDKFMHEFADASLGGKAMYALEPFESSFEKAGQPDVPLNVRLSFDNTTTGLAAGAAVELLALGSYVYPDWIPPATFQVVAKGHVSIDGSHIDLDPGEGLPYLTWVLLRLAP